MNSSINQVASTVYNTIGSGLPLPQFMPPVPFPMAYPCYPTIFQHGSFVQPIYVTPNMNQGINHSGMNYTGNIHPAMINPMQQPYPTPVMSPRCSPSGKISLQANSHSMVPTGCGIWPHFFAVPTRFHEAQPITPISPFESSMSIGQDEQSVASEAHRTIVPMETLIPPARRNISLQKANKRKLDEKEIVIPIKKLNNGYTVESITDDEIVLPPPRRNFDRPTGIISDIMPMPPPAPGSLYAGSMACNHHPDDTSAICSAVHRRSVVSAPFNSMSSRRTSQSKKPQRILSSIRKRNEHIYSSNLMENVLPIGLSIEEIMARNGMVRSIPAMYEGNVPPRLNVQNRGVRHKPTPMRTPVYSLPRGLMLPGPSNEHSQDEERFVPEGNTVKEEGSENGEEISSDNREWML